MQELEPQSGIYAVDAHYVDELIAAIHLIKQDDHVAIIDTGTQFSVPQVQAALQQLGLAWQNVDYIILTHIHLDHAGGAGALMQLCENAQLVVHPKGARHMADPSKLIAGAEVVYGKQRFAEMYGEISAIDEQRIYSPDYSSGDGESISLNSRELRFFDTPGHANHHHCIFDVQSKSMFTGDTAGVGYPSLTDGEYRFVMPTTTPVQFDPEALHNSIDKIMAQQPETLYLTHYSAVKPSVRMIAGLHEQIEDFIAMTEQTAASENMQDELTIMLTDYAVRRCMNELPNIDESLARKLLAMDSELNAQGLTFWWQHKREATA